LANERAVDCIGPPNIELVKNVGRIGVIGQQVKNLSGNMWSVEKSGTFCGHP
jgi:hypothetical protein